MPASPPPPAPGTPPSQAEAGGVGEVFGAFLRLGLTSFGGPVAHLGYFRHEFVQRRRWLDDASALFMLAFALGLGQLDGLAASGALHGLKL
ncbi:chromate transporter, partial [Bordetella pertussis]|uniref:chromate transporter n=1 Tax=Bordetella pertussis TaxID=520 RepID=UPI000A7F6E3B